MWLSLFASDEVTQPVVTQAPTKPHLNTKVYVPLVLRAPALMPTPSPANNANFFLRNMPYGSIVTTALPQIMVDARAVAQLPVPVVAPSVESVAGDCQVVKLIRSTIKARCR